MALKMIKLNTGSKEIDWKKLSAIELASFEQELNSQQWPIEDLASMIAYALIDSEFNLSSIDPNFVKLFKVAQILIKILLEKYLKFKNVEKVMKSKGEVIKENQKLRSLLNLYKQFYTNGLEIEDESFHCPNCPKSFSEIHFLKQHLLKRHPNSGLESQGILSLSKKIHKYNSDLMLNFYPVGEMKKEMDDIKEKLKQAQLELNNEREAREDFKNRIEQEFAVKLQQLEKFIKETDKNISHFKLSKVTEGKQNEFEENQSSLNQYRQEENKQLQDILMLHTQEVRNLGSRMNKLIDKLTPSSSTPSVSSTVTVSEFKTDQNLDIQAEQVLKQVKSKSDDDKTNVEVESKQIDVKKSQYNHQDVVKEIENILQRLGVKDNFNKITEKQYELVMEKINQFRIKAKTLNQVDELKNLIEYEIKNVDSKHVINKNLNLKDQDKQKPISENKQTGEKKVIKSLLIKNKDNQKEQSVNKPFKKLRFSDNNIEISPSSSSDEDKEEDLQDEVEVDEDIEEDDDDDDDDYLNQLLTDLSSERPDRQDDNKRSIQIINEIIDSAPSKVNQEIDDQLKVSDLKWFDYDKIDKKQNHFIMDKDDQDEDVSKQILIKDDNVDKHNSNNDIIESKDKNKVEKSEQNDQDSKACQMKVKELTNIIEKQLVKRNERLNETKRLVNVVNTVPITSKISDLMKDDNSDSE